MTEEGKKLVVDEGVLPCGCKYTKYSDETQGISPCVGHGLQAAAQSLMQAAHALGALSDRIIGEQQISSAIRGVVHGKD